MELFKVSNFASMCTCAIWKSRTQVTICEAITLCTRSRNYFLFGPNFIIPKYLAGRATFGHLPGDLAGQLQSIYKGIQATNQFK